MASLSDVYIKVDVLEKLLATVKAKNEKGLSITISVNDDTNDYGQNVNSYVSQTKEQRDAKTPKYYVGNGKTFWTDGNIKVAEKKEQSATAPVSTPTVEEPLPF